MIVALEDKIRTTLLGLPGVSGYFPASEVVFNTGERAVPPAISIVHESSDITTDRRVEDPRRDPGNAPIHITHMFDLTLIYPGTETREKRGEMEDAVFPLPRELNKANPKLFSSWEEIGGETFEAEAVDSPRRRTYNLSIMERR